jgi:hypothetical protein
MSAPAATLDIPAWSPTGNDLRRIEAALARLGWAVVTKDELHALTVIEIAVHAPVELSSRQTTFLAALKRRWADRSRSFGH